jgi:SAM-dependent methyltransferase
MLRTAGTVGTPGKGERMGQLVDEQRKPLTVSLSEVYDLDMGRRISDVGLWGQYTSGCSVIEVGCGNGRVPRLLETAASLEATCEHPAMWVGIDLDDRMVKAANALGIDWFGALVGDVRDPGTWSMARSALGGPAQRIVIPYSTLFLVPHEDQADALRLAMGSLEPDGLLLAECFIPSMTRDHVSEVRCRIPDEMVHYFLGNYVERWLRRSEFSVDSASRTTVVDRYYGPSGEPVYHVHEVIYWRRPAELLELAEEAGLAGAEVLTGKPVPPGFVLLAARG